MAHQLGYIWGFMLENTLFIEFDVSNHAIIEHVYQQNKSKQASHHIIIRDSHLPCDAKIYFGVAQIHLRMPGTRYYVKRRTVPVAMATTSNVTVHVTNNTSSTLLNRHSQYTESIPQSQQLQQQDYYRCHNPSSHYHCQVIPTQQRRSSNVHASYLMSPSSSTSSLSLQSVPQASVSLSFSPFSAQAPYATANTMTPAYSSPNASTSTQSFSASSASPSPFWSASSSSTLLSITSATTSPTPAAYNNPEGTNTLNPVTTATTTCNSNTSNHENNTYSNLWNYSWLDSFYAAPSSSSMQALLIPWSTTPPPLSSL